jgi:uncharacterized protein DUF6510
MHVDGNAAGGLLSEVFARDVTAAACTCDSCGNTEPLAAAMTYMRGPGTVLRCIHCERVLIRVARVRERLVVDTAGVRRLELGG